MRYRVITIEPDADQKTWTDFSAKMEKQFNDLAAEGYVFKETVQQFGTSPAGAKVIAIFQLAATGN